MQAGTGTLQQIQRADGHAGEFSAKPVVLPVNAARLGLMNLGLFVAALGAAAWIRRLTER